MKSCRYVKGFQLKSYNYFTMVDKETLDLKWKYIFYNKRYKSKELYKSKEFLQLTEYWIWKLKTFTKKIHILKRHLRLISCNKYCMHHFSALTIATYQQPDSSHSCNGWRTIAIICDTVLFSWSNWTHWITA